MPKYLLALMFAALLPQAQGSFLEFSNRATFTATVTGVVLNTFETPAAPTSLDAIDATIDLSTVGGDTVVHVSTFGFGFGQAIGGSAANLQDSFKPILITFSAPYYAIGFDDLDLTQSPTEVAIIEVEFANGESTLVTRDDPDSSFATAPFWGIWSNVAIKSVQVYSVEALAADPVLRANLIDNLVYSRNVAPLSDVAEPATFWVGAMGITVLGLLRQKGLRQNVELV